MGKAIEIGGGVKAKSGSFTPASAVAQDITIAHGCGEKPKHIVVTVDSSAWQSTYTTRMVLEFLYNEGGACTAIVRSGTNATTFHGLYYDGVTASTYSIKCDVANIYLTSVYPLYTLEYQWVAYY